MQVTPKLIEDINEQVQKVPIAETRWPELAIELGQLREAAEKVAERHEFDRNPATFLATLRRLAP